MQGIPSRRIPRWPRRNSSLSSPRDMARVPPSPPPSLPSLAESSLFFEVFGSPGGDTGDTGEVCSSTSALACGGIDGAGILGGSPDPARVAAGCDSLCDAAEDDGSMGVVAAPAGESAGRSRGSIGVGDSLGSSKPCCAIKCARSSMASPAVRASRSIAALGSSKRSTSGPASFWSKISSNFTTGPMHRVRNFQAPSSWSLYFASIEL